ncbi:hypothetical protein F383_34239 [Gossypium arboreum]|uniref:Uncharacterized protein n=1 Tax=Gossypium arboreum TaxID=29729 RepID=A0A0B0PSS5_GOSAR|nr:hypothetical protein F383_34239 [Gossypium arboreum]
MCLSIYIPRLIYIVMIINSKLCSSLSAKLAFFF